MTSAARLRRLALAAGVLMGMRTAAAASPVIIVVEAEDEAGRALGDILEKDLAGKTEVRALVYSADSIANPIFKGRLLAALSRAKLVVPVGDSSTGLALEELEGSDVYFVGASAVPGKQLANPRVSGVLSYSPDDVFASIPRQWSRDFGLLYTPGYEPVLDQVRAAAQRNGVSIRERRVTQRSRIPETVDRLLPTVAVLWVLGDPAIAREAGFDHVAEQALSYDKPLIGSSGWEVLRGAAFCSQARPESLAARASTSILELLGGGSKPRVETAPPGGTIVYHPGLAKRYGLSPKGPTWIRVQ